MKSFLAFPVIAAFKASEKALSNVLSMPKQVGREYSNSKRRNAQRRFGLSVGVQQG